MDAITRGALLLLVAIAGCTGAPAGGPSTTADVANAPATTPTPTAPPVAGTPTPAGTPTTASPTPDPPTVAFVVDGAVRAVVTVEVADSPPERRRGLMGRRSLAPGRGMLFVFPGEAERVFWMKDTYVPLDMVFVDANGTVLNVEHAAPQPNASDAELRRYRSDGPAKYVIEVRRGFANRTGVGPGTEVVIEGAGTSTPGG